MVPKLPTVPGGPDAPSIPQPSLRRLPQYHHYLVDLAAKGISQVSCSLIGRDLNLVPVQVRKDLQYTGIIGKPKTGYSVSELVQAIETFLGWNNVNEAFLVGVGNLGTALLGHERFSKFGLRIVAAFDSDPGQDWPMDPREGCFSAGPTGRSSSPDEHSPWNHYNTCRSGAGNRR